MLPGVSEKVLAAQLRELEADGLVLRASAHTIPPRVDYRLSPAGEELIPILERMCVWAATHLAVPPTFRPRAAAISSQPLGQCAAFPAGT